MSGSVSPGAGAVTFTGIAPSTSWANVLTPGAGAVALAGYAPTFDNLYSSISPPAGSLVLGGGVPLLEIGQNYPAIALPQSLKRWRGACGINWLGMALVGDAFSNVVGLSNFRAFTEYGETMQFLVTTPPLHEDRKRIFVPRFEIEVAYPETGPLTPDIATSVYCAIPVDITPPTTLSNVAPSGVAAYLTTALFSVWVYLPPADPLGIAFSNQTDITLGSPVPGFAIIIQNDTRGTPQIIVAAYDDLSVPIVYAEYNYASWNNWLNVMVSIDTTGQQLQVAAGDTVLTATTLTWTSTLPIPTGGTPWVVEPLS